MPYRETECTFNAPCATVYLDIPDRMWYPHSAMNGDLAPIEKSVRFYEKQLQSAQEAFDRARANLDVAERNLALAKSFYDLERRRLHPAAAPSRPLAGMTLREACVTIVTQSGRATSNEILEQLRDGGYDLTTAFPGRAIHAALIRAPGVRKVGPGVYQAASNTASS